MDVLESTFQKTHYPEIRMVDDLSSMLSLSTERISIWFQNRRARFKKSRKLENSQEKATYVSPPLTLASTSSHVTTSNENAMVNGSYLPEKSHYYGSYGNIKFDATPAFQPSLKPVLEAKSMNNTNLTSTFSYGQSMMMPAMSHMHSSHVPFSYQNQIDSK